MKEGFIPVNEPLLGKRETHYITRCLESGWISSEGPFVRSFEESFASRVGRRHGISVCNGSAALDVAVAALGIGPGDEVVVPSFSIISCTASVVRMGATPVLVDSDPLTWNPAPELIEAAIGQRTKAILVMHTYGLPADIAPILDIARERNIRVIEDAAEMIGQTYRNKPCGGFGDISTMSFYANKHVTTGEGGMIFTNDDELAERCLSFRNLCFQKGRRFVHEEMGWNYRLGSLQAALGMGQLEGLNAAVDRKRDMGRLYSELLSDVPGIELPLASTEYADNIYWVYGLLLGDDIPISVDDVMRRMNERGVGTRPFFWPMHRQPVFRKMGLFKGESYPVSERLGERGFYLPSGLTLTDAQIRRVAEILKEVLRR